MMKAKEIGATDQPYSDKATTDLHHAAPRYPLARRATNPLPSCRGKTSILRDSAHEGETLACILPARFEPHHARQLQRRRLHGSGHGGHPILHADELRLHACNLGFRRLPTRPFRLPSPNTIVRKQCLARWLERDFPWAQTA